MRPAYRPASLILLLAAWPSLGCVEPTAELGRATGALDEAPTTEEFALEETVVATDHPVRVAGAPGELADRLIKLDPGAPGELTIDARDPHALVPVSEHGLAFDSDEDFVKYMIERFNARPIELASGQLGFELTVTTLGSPYYAAGWTGDGATWDGTIVETRTPVLAMLGGLDGTITIRDRYGEGGHPVETPKYARGRCVLNQDYMDWDNPNYLDRGFESQDCSGQSIMNDVFPQFSGLGVNIATGVSVSEVRRQIWPEKRVCDGSWDYDCTEDGTVCTFGPRCTYQQYAPGVTTSIQRSVLRSGDGRAWSIGRIGPREGNTSVFHMFTTTSRDNFVCGHHVTEATRSAASGREVLWDTLTADGVRPIVPDAERFLCADGVWGP